MRLVKTLRLQLIEANMDIRRDFERFMFHPKVREFYELFNSVDKNGYPSMNYFGINFNGKGIYTFKFYFGFFNKLQEHEVLKFLPHSRDFSKYYRLWRPSRVRNYDNSGCTFELKFKLDLDPIIGFHFRIPPSSEAYDLIGYPSQLPYTVDEIGHYPGINYEYSRDSVLRKKYYYLSTQNQKQYIAERFHLPFATDAEIIEYTETDKYAKVNVWRFDRERINIDRPNVFNEYGSKMIKYIKDNYGLLNISDGYYENSDIRAAYFFNTVNKSRSPFSEPENDTIDTLRLFYPK